MKMKAIHTSKGQKKNGRKQHLKTKQILYTIGKCVYISCVMKNRLRCCIQETREEEKNDSK